MHNAPQAISHIVDKAVHKKTGPVLGARLDSHFERTAT